MKTFADIPLKSKPGIMSNGSFTKPPEDRLHTFLLSLATSALVGCFLFLWNTNRDQGRMEQKIDEMARAVDQIQIRVNNTQLDVRDTRERVIRLEAKNEKK